MRGSDCFNLGARYTPGGEQGRVTFRIYADNIANKRYWSDTGASYGDTFVWEGAPATVRLSARLCTFLRAREAGEKCPSPA